MDGWIRKKSPVPKLNLPRSLVKGAFACCGGGWCREKYNKMVWQGLAISEGPKKLAEPTPTGRKAYILERAGVVRTEDTKKRGGRIVI